MEQLLKRIIPKLAERFIIETIPAIDGKNIYEVSKKGEFIVLRGDNKVSQAMAFNAYLKKVCKVNWSWVGNREVVLEKLILPTADIKQIVEQKYRVYMNYCTFSYSMAWWDWARWQKEIDFMAMNGINMPLMLIGTEAVWYYTLQKFGFSKEDALKTISSNAFWPWQAMTNIEGYMPAPNEEYIFERLELGKKILERQIEFGMIPIQQGFSGHIPIKMAELFPKAKIKLKGKWCDFQKTAQLDPLDPLFERFGKELLKTQEEYFGKHHFYACDPFHEGTPPSGAPFYLRKVAKAIEKLYINYDSKACWVMQSWSLRKGIVKAISKDRLLILDIDGTRCAKFKEFWGYQFVSGVIHNFGGKNSLHGNLATLAENAYAKWKSKGLNVVGTGLFMEGIEQNPVYYDLAFEVGTESKPIDINLWIEDYAERRYGAKDKNALAAWKMLLDCCYQSKGCLEPESECGSTICAYTDLFPTKNCCEEIKVIYDNEKLLAALKLLLKSKDKLGKSDGYQFDVCDIMRQYLSNTIILRQNKVKQYFEKKDATNFKLVAQMQISTMKDIDNLLSCRSELCLSTWVNAAANLATNEKERHFFVKCAKLLVTIWGDIDSDATLFDYAWREWNGLISEYYIPRWEQFYAYANKCLENNQPLEKSRSSFFGKPRNMATAIYSEQYEWQKKWVNTYVEYPVSKDRDIVPTVLKLIEKIQE